MGGLERTVVVVKPDGNRKERLSYIRNRLKGLDGIEIESERTDRLDPNFVERFYHHVIGRFGIEDYMTSGNVKVLIVSGIDAVARVSALVGNSPIAAECPEGTIRRELFERYGTKSPTENFVHASKQQEVREELVWVSKRYHPYNVPPEIARLKPGFGVVGILPEVDRRYLRDITEALERRGYRIVDKKTVDYWPSAIRETCIEHPIEDPLKPEKQAIAGPYAEVVKSRYGQKCSAIMLLVLKPGINATQELDNILGPFELRDPRTLRGRFGLDHPLLDGFHQAGFRTARELESRGANLEKVRNFEIYRLFGDN